MRPRAYLMLFTLALIWGASFLFIKIGVQEMPPATLVTLRLAFGAATLGVIVAARPALAAGWRRYWRLAILVAIFNVMIPYLLISWGETQIFSGTASILNATTPLFTVLLASVWIGTGREALSWRKGLGILIGFLGVFVVFGLDARAFSDQSLPMIQGELAVVVASASYGVGGLLSRRYAGKDTGTLVGPLTSLTAALIISIPVALLWDPPTALPSWTAIRRHRRARRTRHRRRLPLLLLADSQCRRATHLDGHVLAALHRAVLGVAGLWRAGPAQRAAWPGAGAARHVDHQQRLRRNLPPPAEGRAARCAHWNDAGDC